jgi:YD repeat-containing protein
MAEAQTLAPPPVSPSSVTRYEYDAEGFVTKVIRGAGTLNLETRFARDSLNRVKEHTDPEGGRAQLEHDGSDRLTQVSDPRRLVTRYPVKTVGDGSQVISPDTGIADLSIDAAGRVTTRIDSRNVVESFTYDVAGRLTGVRYSLPGKFDQASTWTYSQTGAGFGTASGD